MKTVIANNERIQSISIQIIVVIMINVCLISMFSKEKNDPLNLNKNNDSQLYKAVIARVRSGCGYYEAAAAELKLRNYRRDSPLNWRTPVYAWFFSLFPDSRFGWLILSLLLAFAILLASQSAKIEGGNCMQITCTSLLLLSYVWVTDIDKIYMTELWAGVFILSSVCLYHQGRILPGFFLGVLALVARELSIISTIIELYILFKLKNYFLFCSKFIIICFWLFFILIHNYIVVSYMETFHLSASSWLNFGGLPFILHTCRTNYLLWILPFWVSCIYLPLAATALYSWKSKNSCSIKLNMSAYLSFFFFFGKPFNDYWGWICMPILVLGIISTPCLLRGPLGRNRTS